VKLGDVVTAGAPIVSLTQSLRGDGEEVYPMRSPFAGRVTQVLRQEGEYVEQGKENNGIVRIDDQSHLFVYSDVPETEVRRVLLGQDVNIRANAILDRTYHGVIREVFLAAKEKKEWSRTGDRVDFEVRIEITDKDEALHPGMSAIIDIITATRKATVTLPHEYVLRGNEKDEGKFFVTLENGERREVKLGLQNEESVEIIEGVKEGERVRIVDFFSLPRRT
jgi:HlyD family secretion protein